MNTKVGRQHDRSRASPWRVYWWGMPDESGKQRKYTKSFRHANDAKLFQVERQHEINRNGLCENTAKLSLAELLDEFWNARVAPLSPNSHAGYRNTFDQLREYFGCGRTVREIRQQDAETFMATRKRVDGRKGELSSSAKKLHLTYARAAFSAAVEWGYLDRNPFGAVTTRGSTPLRVRVKGRSWHHITPNEFQSILAVAPDVRHRAFYWLGYGCGMRPGEIYHLTIDRIDLDRRQVRIESRPATADLPPFTVKCDAVSSESKARTVPIPEAAVADLTQAMQGAFAAGGFVVLTPERFATVQCNWRLCHAGKGWGRHEHRAWENSDMVNNTLRAANAHLRLASIKLTASFNLKSFRKSFGQNHADAGTPPKVLASLMGHSDASVTMEFYNRVTDANQSAAAATMDRILSDKSIARGSKEAV